MAWHFELKVILKQLTQMAQNELKYYEVKDTLYILCW